jgi:hypothetical protein
VDALLTIVPLSILTVALSAAAFWLQHRINLLASELQATVALIGALASRVGDAEQAAKDGVIPAEEQFTARDAELVGKAMIALDQRLTQVEAWYAFPDGYFGPDRKELGE